MTFKNLLLICLMFIFVIACGSETSDVSEPQTANPTEASGAAQDIADEHSDEEGQHDGEDSDEHSDEEGQHDGEDSDEHSDEEDEHDGEEADEHTDDDEEGRRELGAHEHGVAALMIAWSGSDVAIDLETPAYNILGFEYAPTSDEEKALLKETVAVLEAGGLLQFNPDAQCTLVSATVQTQLSKEAHDEDKEGHTEEEGHDEEGHDSNEEGHDEEGHDEEGHSEESHSDIDVSYNLECQAPENIESLDASNLFAQFPNFEDIHVQWISDTEQSAGDLIANNPVLTFK